MTRAAPVIATPGDHLVVTLALISAPSARPGGRWHVSSAMHRDVANMRPPRAQVLPRLEVIENVGGPVVAWEPLEGVAQQFQRF